MKHRAGASARAQGWKILKRKARRYSVLGGGSLATVVGAGAVLDGPVGAGLAGLAVTSGGVFLGRRAWRGSEAGRWFQGAAGEARTAHTMRRLKARGWAVFHDLTIPGSRANIDHLAILPEASLVAVLDTKAWHAKGAKVRFSGGKLWYGPWDQTSKVETIRWETLRAAQELQTRAFSILVLDGGRLDSRHHDKGWAEIDPEFYVVEQDHLVKFLRDVPGQRRDKARVKALTAVVNRQLPAYRR